MNAGYGRKCITPPIGCRLDGWADPKGERLVEGVIDDLFVRVVFMEDEHSRVLVISHDLLFFARQYVDSIKGAIARMTGIPASHVLMNVTHTHAAPQVGEWSYQALLPPQMDYIKDVISATLAAVGEAMQRAVPCRLFAGTAQTCLPVNRRKPDGKGGVTWAVHSEGAICPVVPVLDFRNESGQTVAFIYSVSCHTSNIGGNKVCADYAGATCRMLDTHFGGACSLFLQGAGGDTKACVVADSPDGLWRGGAPDDIEKAGALLFSDIQKTINVGLMEVTPGFRCYAYETSWPLQAVPSQEEIEAKVGDPVLGPYYQELLRRLHAGKTLPSCASLTAQGIRFGDGVRLIALEGELVADLGALIIAEYGSGVTIPLGYSNGTGLYLPTSHQIDERGYEVDSYIEYYYPAALAKGTENIVRGIVSEMRQHGI